MIVWLITCGEQLPIDGEDIRLMRTGLLANFLAQAGHRVVWWSSTFNHITKKHRFDCDHDTELSCNLKLRLLHGIGYKRHVSFSRFLDHYLVAQKFYNASSQEVPPDLMVASFPTPELALAASLFSRRMNIPMVLDIRDLWPDAFAYVLRPELCYLAKPGFALFRRMAQYSCSTASAIIGPAKRYVDWGVDLAHRYRNLWDREFPFAYTRSAPTIEKIEAAEDFWKRYGITKHDPGFLISFFGTLGRQFDLGIIIESARILSWSHPKIRFMICGTGDHHEMYMTLSKDCPNVIYPGWIGAAEIWTLMRMSSVGLAPYHPNSLFSEHLPNKPLEYLSAGLPVLTSLSGVLGSLLTTNNCGYIYRDADELTGTITMIYENRALLKQLSTNAFQLYHHSFEAEQIYPQMVQFLEQVAHGV